MWKTKLFTVPPPSALFYGGDPVSCISSLPPSFFYTLRPEASRVIVFDRTLSLTHVQMPNIRQKIIAESSPSDVSIWKLDLYS